MQLNEKQPEIETTRLAKPPTLLGAAPMARNEEPRPELHPSNLWDLRSTEYTLKHPVTIFVEQWPESEFIAHWHDIEAVGFGESTEEAIADLCECTIELYEHLIAKPDEKLGKVPLKTKEILKKVIGQIKQRDQNHHRRIKTQL